MYQILAGSEYALASYSLFFDLCEKTKKKKKTKNKNWNFGLSYLGNAWHDLLQFWNPASPYRRAVPQQIWWSSGKRLRIYGCVKIATLLFLLIYSLRLRAPQASWAARHTTMCLDKIEQQYVVHHKSRHMVVCCVAQLGTQMEWVYKQKQQSCDFTHMYYMTPQPNGTNFTEELLSIQGTPHFKFERNLFSHSRDMSEQKNN